MKNRYKLLSLAGIVSLFVACNFLEPEALSLTSDTNVFSNNANVKSLRNNMFTFLPDGYANISNSWLASATDEAEEVGEAENIQNFNTGNWNMYSNPDNVWVKNYQGIRKTWDFLQGTDTITWSEYKVNDPVNYAARMQNLKYWRSEARFLQAFFYFELIKRYGGVPVVDHKLDIVKDYDYMVTAKRDSFAKCVRYIATLCDSAAKYLPLKQTEVANTDWGVPTRGAALALKARTLLYAASDLFNQTGNTNPFVGYTDDKRTERWAKAAIANKAILNLMSAVPYSFQSTYSALFLLKTVRSNEVIFERRYPASNTFETLNYPIGYQSGKTGTCPTQNLVDAYDMTNGSTFDWLNPVMAANPYANRDPRLLQTVIVNNSVWKSVNVQLWQGGANGKPIYHASKTGYYLKKYVDESLNLTTGLTSAKQWIYFRLGETYLNYAEAMNEAFGPTVTDTLKISALQALNSVRTRPGVAMPALAASLTRDELRLKIRKERRVELAFEDHRYWDVRRWKIAESSLGAMIQGVNIAKDAGGAFSYSLFDLEKRVFESKMYLYPIPQSEIVKGNGNMVQNPGWN
jgi:hypothetical protein